jgi:hypothetical protein
MSEGTGLTDDVDAVLTFKTCMFDYNGSQPVPVPALHVHGEIEGGDTFDEYYSAGSASKLRASDDGTTFEPVTEGATLNKNSKTAQFIVSVLNAAGGDLAPPENVTEWDGLTAHLDRRADAQRKGINAENARGQKRTILLVTSILGLPGKKAKKAGAKKTAKTDDSAVDAAIEGVLADNDGEIPVANLSRILFRALKGNPALKAITKRAQEDSYLESDDRPFNFDGETISV